MITPSGRQPFSLAWFADSPSLSGPEHAKPFKQGSVSKDLKANF